MAQIHKSNDGYNYDFKMIMEGVDVKFISAAITCTPNGNEATVNIHSVLEAFGIKPKTSVQIWYKEWWADDAKWRLLFDGETGRFDKSDSVSDGAGIAITCRDFRMATRKAPCAVVFGGDTGSEMLGTWSTLNGGGVYLGYRYPGTRSINGKNTLVFDNTGTADLYNILSMVAGTAQSISTGETTAGESQPKTGSQSADAAAENAKNPGLNSGFTAATGVVTTPATIAQSDESTPAVKYNALFGADSDEGHWFMDAFVKGLWIESVGGSMVPQYANRRMRVEKRWASMKNEAGYRLFINQQMANWGKAYVMGGARFTSIEAMIMRVAGLFMYRPYSINNPPLIDLSDPAQRHYFCSQRVYDNFVSNQKLFGAKFMAPFTILTPPLEFTAPPNCNVFLPAMYNQVTWLHDDDAEPTRGYFSVADTFGSSESTDPAWEYSIQVPNTILNYGGAVRDYEIAMKFKDDVDVTKKISVTIGQPGTTPTPAGATPSTVKPSLTTTSKSGATSAADNKSAAKIYDAYIKTSPSMSLEERFTGVNIAEGTVSDHMARNELASNIHRSVFSAKKAADIDQQLAKAQADAVSSTAAAPAPGDPNVLTSMVSGGAAQIADLQAQAAAANDRLAELKQQYANDTDDLQHKINLTQVLEQHATVKFINQKFAGRVAQIQMELNPFPICGFPGVLVADARDTSGAAYGFQTRKSITGTVQQVSHMIHAAGTASTSIVMNNARYVDEPTYMNRDGLPTYLPPTTPDRADFDIVGLKYKNYSDDQYFVNDDAPLYNYVRKQDIDILNGVDINLPKNVDPKYRYAKDFTTVSMSGLSHGQSNLSYIDLEYAPNLITRFYCTCLGQDPRQSLMLKSWQKPLDSTPRWYMFDSVHEAVENLEYNAQLLYSYDDAIRFCQRDIVDITGFYMGILDMAICDENGNFVKYTGANVKATYLKTSGDLPVFSGVSDSEWLDMARIADSGTDTNALNVQYGRGKIPAGPENHLSLEIEHSPRTCFTRTRNDAVLAYAQAISGYAFGVVYAYDK